jgi:hypothetical protein
MSINLPSFYVQQYATNIQLLLQQKGSNLRPFVMSGSHVGKQASPVDQIAAVAMQAVSGRFQPMGRVDAAVDRRWVFPSDYDLPQLIDSFDKLRLLTDPQSHYVQNAVYAAGRQYDDLIIAASSGTAKTGETGSTSTVRLSGNDVAVNFGSSADCGLTVAKLREAKRLLMKNQVDLKSDQIICVVNAQTHDNLLSEIQVVNTDYNVQNGQPVLQDGIIKRFLGIDFVYSERLIFDATDTDATLVPVYAKSGLYLGVWNDMATKISQRDDLQGLPWQAYVYMTAGATRLEEKKVTQILCE